MLKGRMKSKGEGEGEGRENSPEHHWPERRASPRPKSFRIKSEGDKELMLEFLPLTNSFQADLHLKNPHREAMNYEFSNNIRNKLTCLPYTGSISPEGVIIASVFLRKQWLNGLSFWDLDENFSNIGDIKIHFNLESNYNTVDTQNIKVLLSHEAFQKLKDMKNIFSLNFFKSIHISGLPSIPIFTYPKIFFFVILLFSFLYFDFCFI